MNRDYYEYPSLPDDEDYFDLLERSEDAADSAADDEFSEREPKEDNE